MASPIITAIRQRRDLKESVLHTAQELAHRASIYGVVRASNAYMGGKCHCHGRTFQRHVVRLVEARILKKTVVKKVVKIKVGARLEERLRNEVNVYTFTLPWHTSASSTVPMDRMSSNLPPPDITQNAMLRNRGDNPREKTSGLTAELANQQRTLRLLTPGSGLWERTREEITRLEHLLPTAVALAGH